MKNMIRGIIMAGALWAVVGLPAHSTQTQPDNTNANKQDQKPQAINADKAQNNLSDRELMAHIRRDIVKDKSLSTYAHNVKVVSANGKVTLRGPVRSDQERQLVEQYAKKYAGDKNVTDEVTVRSSGS
jgi:hyperosmotically inducible protein